jgi:hypothetical protein
MPLSNAEPDAIIAEMRRLALQIIERQSPMMAGALTAMFEQYTRDVERYLTEHAQPAETTEEQKI